VIVITLICLPLVVIIIELHTKRTILHLVNIQLYLIQFQFNKLCPRMEISMPAYHQVLVAHSFLYVTITILHIIHRPVFYLKLNVSETGFCLRLQVEPSLGLPLYLLDPTV
jgi:hypothetical protein